MASEFLTAISSAFGEAPVSEAVAEFKRTGGNATPSVVAKALASCMASYKGALLRALVDAFGPWDCAFARDVLLAVEFEFERAGVAEEFVPFVNDLENFERVAIGEGCPLLQGYARTTILGRVQEEMARRNGATAAAVPAAAVPGGASSGDGSAIFIPPTLNPNPLVSNSDAATAASPVPVAASAMPVPPGGVGARPVLAPVAGPGMTVVGGPGQMMGGQPMMVTPQATAIPVSPQTAVPVMQQQGQQVRVQIPPGLRPGQVMQVRAPNGQMFGVAVPAGAVAGSVIIAQAPAMQTNGSTVNVIQPRGVGGGNPGSFQVRMANQNSSILARRQAESRRKRQIMIFIGIVVFFIVFGNIIGTLVSVGTASEDWTQSSDDTNRYTSISSRSASCADEGYRSISGSSDCRAAASTQYDERLTQWHFSESVTSVSRSDEPSGCYLKILQYNAVQPDGSSSSTTAHFYYNTMTSTSKACNEYTNSLVFDQYKTSKFVCMCKE
jgi:hypothetical protein